MSWQRLTIDVMCMLKRLATVFSGRGEILAFCLCPQLLGPCDQVLPSDKSRSLPSALLQHAAESVPLTQRSLKGFVLLCFLKRPDCSQVFTHPARNEAWALG